MTLNFKDKNRFSEPIIFWGLGVCFFFTMLFLLLCFVKIDGKTFSYIFSNSPFNYFELLSEAFIDGRLNIYPRNKVIHDLSITNGKYYLYWPPSPSLFLLPFVYLFGTELPDRLISIFLASVNFSLLLFVLRRLSDTFKYKLSTPSVLLIGIFWSASTVNFNVSFEGSVWYISQVFSLFFQLLSFYFILNNKPKYLLSGLFFMFAVYTRNTMVFSGVLYCFLIYVKDWTNFKYYIFSLFKFSFFFIVGSLINFWYNFIRFGSLLDNGLTKHNMGPWFRKDFEEYGYFNVHFIPYNMYYEWFKAPTFLGHFPFIGFDLKGFGMFWLSPLFVLLFFTYKSFSEGVYNNIKIFNLLNFFNIGITTFLIFMIMGRGVQFGARYSLDYHISLIFLLAFVFSIFQDKLKFKIVVSALLLIGIYFNTIGAYYMAIRW